MAETREQAFAVASQFYTEIENARIQGRRLGQNRRSVSARTVSKILNSIIDALGEYVNESTPPIALSNMHIDGSLTLAPGPCPSIHLNNVGVDLLEICDVDVLGSLRFHQVDIDTGQLRIKGTHVRGPTEFKHVNFGAGTISGSQFHRDVLFSHVKVEAIEGKVVFHDVAHIEQTTIHRLDAVEFVRPARLLVFAGPGGLKIDSCTFRESANFSGSILQRFTVTETHFMGKGTEGCASFDDVTVNKDLLFDHAIFSSVGHFDKAKLYGPIRFPRTIFLRPPTFYGAHLHPDISFHSTRFHAGKTHDDLSAFRQLKNLARDQYKSSSDEGLFFMYEQRTRASLDLRTPGKRFGGCISSLYDWGSNYGENVVKPLWWIVLVNVLAYFAYSGSCTYPGSGSAAAVSPVLGFTAQNIFAPFSFLSKAAQYCVVTNVTLPIALAQSALTLALFALWLLAIRRRLRKGSE